MTQPTGPHNPRIGDTERQQAVAALAEHVSHGRISQDEYELRITHATEAITASDLATLFTDLPEPRPILPAPTGNLPVPTVAAAFQPTPVHPHYPVPRNQQVSEKSKLVAGLLQILLPMGIGRFYTGHVGIGVAQLLFFLGAIPTCGFSLPIAVIWCFIDGIVLLAGNSRDSHGRPLRS